MTDGKYQKIQGLKDELFQSKTEEAFNEVLEKLGEAVNADPTLSDTYKEKLRGYVKNLRTKKQEYWKKFANKPAYAPKSSFIFREEEGKAFIGLCNALTAYLNRHNDAPNEDLPDLCPGKPSRYVTRITEGEVDPYEK